MVVPGEHRCQGKLIDPHGNPTAGPDAIQTWKPASRITPRGGRGTEGLGFRIPNPVSRGISPRERFYFILFRFVSFLLFPTGWEAAVEAKAGPVSLFDGSDSV